MNIVIVTGTRPQLIKTALLDKRLRQEHNIIMIHTGQHYDDNMSSNFFKELDIPQPDINLGIRAEMSHQQLGKTIRALGDYLNSLFHKPDLAIIIGDSVTADAKIPLYTKQGEYLGEHPIADLFTKVDYHTPSGKELHYLPLKRHPNAIYTDTIDNKGKLAFKRIHYVMRHHTKKKVFRVRFTNEWYLDVTEDHSLFGYLPANRCGRKTLPHERIVPITPLDISNGRNPRVIRSLIIKKQSSRCKVYSKNYPRELYELMGYFIGDGSFNRKLPHKQTMLHIACGLDAEEVTQKLLTPLQKAGFIRSIWRKKKGDVAFNGSAVALFNECIRDGVDNTKKVPEFIFQEKNKNIRAFLRGLMSADGTCSLRNETRETKKGVVVYPNPSVTVSTIHKKLASKIQEVFHLIGIATSICRTNRTNTYNGKDSGTHNYHVYVKNTFKYTLDVGFTLSRKQDRLKSVKSSCSKYRLDSLDVDINPIRLDRVEEIQHNDYVYDIEVEDTHRFFANNILVHNTNTALAGALAASKLHIPIAHVEAGCRCGDMSVPEEINRILVDRMSTLLFTPSLGSQSNLCDREGLSHGGVHFTGDVLYDTYLHYSEYADAMAQVYNRDEPSPLTGGYIFVTIHREANTTGDNTTMQIIHAIAKLGNHVVFPLHPRTKKVLQKSWLWDKMFNCHLVPPMGYIETLSRIRGADLIITDSGGIHREAYFAQVPCIYIGTAGWSELFRARTSKQVPADTEAITEAVLTFSEPQFPEGILGNGTAVENIAGIIREWEICR